MNISIQADTNDLIGKLEALKENLVKSVEKTETEIFNTAVDNIRSATPVDTGKLLNSITAETTETGYRVGTDVTYAPYVEYGTNRVPAHHMFENAFNYAQAELEQKAYSTLDNAVNQNV